MSPLLFHLHITHPLKLVLSCYQKNIPRTAGYKFFNPIKQDNIILHATLLLFSFQKCIKCVHFFKNKTEVFIAVFTCLPLGP